VTPAQWMQSLIYAVGAQLNVLLQVYLDGMLTDPVGALARFQAGLTALHQAVTNILNQPWFPPQP